MLELCSVAAVDQALGCDMWTKLTVPERYHEGWREPFDARLASALQPGVVVLDVGPGRRPTLPLDQRPPACHYAALDISEAELRRAPAGSYDEMWLSDVSHRVPDLEGRFDVVVSWQVLEHVKPLDVAMENLRRYLRPGGRLVAQFSGTFSVFGLINRAVPHRLGCWAMRHVFGRPPETVFPAYYHRCWNGALTSMLSSWQSFEIVPRYVGAGYFQFSRVAQWLYLAYESEVMRQRRTNLATHYVIAAVR
jgi:SAM-dependent methyltransferase